MGRSLHCPSRCSDVTAPDRNCDFSRRFRTRAMTTAIQRPRKKARNTIQVYQYFPQPAMPIIVSAVTSTNAMNAGWYTDRPNARFS